MMSFRAAPWSRVARLVSTTSRHGRALYSTTPASSTSTGSSKALRYIAAAGLVGVPGLWWLSNEKNPSSAVPSFKSHASTEVPFERGLSPNEVTKCLSKDSFSFQVGNVPGVSRYDGAQLPSNTICEDTFIHGTLPSPLQDGSTWGTWAVFDGHAGWQTAEVLTKSLLPSVQASLSQAKSASGSTTVSDQTIQDAVAAGFVNLDNAIMKAGVDALQKDAPLQDRLKTAAVGYAGSCALLSLFDPTTNALHVACTGDSRAVLGQQNADGTWGATALSVDQTGSNEDEIARVNREHPGEKSIFKGGRVLGLMVTRAFGDGRHKWPVSVQQDLADKLGIPPPLDAKRYEVKTPPYVTAEPLVTTTKLDPKRPSFLILGSDGLWDNISNEHAVELVGKWLSSNAGAIKDAQNSSTKREAFDFGQFKDKVSFAFEKDRTTVQDGNAAVHLLRNSLGGNHEEMVSGRVSAEPPFSRYIRDDVTIQVVFFNVPGISSK